MVEGIKKRLIAVFEIMDVWKGMNQTLPFGADLAPESKIPPYKSTVKNRMSEGVGWWKVWKIQGVIGKRVDIGIGYSV